jgi:hypothetical protein
LLVMKFLARYFQSFRLKLKRKQFQLLITASTV